MRRSLGIAVALVACAALVLGGSAFARGKAETKVKIKAQSGGFYGYVKSDKTKCANGREVVLYKQKGDKQKPSKDKEIGSDIAQANGTKYMWAIGNSGYKHGKFYAKVGKTSECKGATSKTIER